MVGDFICRVIFFMDGNDYSDKGVDVLGKRGISCNDDIRGSFDDERGKGIKLSISIIGSFRE